ncbi:MAG: O-antigen ligase family protein [Solirubrobacterales bacterium]|nr:O-antigen ligase family protein [Solirubrobacterales bacterium]
MPDLLTVALGTVGAAAGLWAMLRVDAAWWLSLGIVATAFTSHWGKFGIPVPVDRLLLYGGIAIVVLRLGSSRDRPVIRLNAVHVVLGALVAYAVCSAFWVGTLDNPDARYEILDRLGAVPFVLYAIAPVTFRLPRQRGILLGVVVCFGFYLACTAVFEGVKPLHSLVFPNYILDPQFGLHTNRARGPFLEAVGMGLGLIAGMAAAAIALGRWRDPIARGFAWLTLLITPAGIALTYTRSVWLAAAISVTAGLAAYPDLRPKLVPIAALAAGSLALAIAAVPGLGRDLSQRYNESGPVWVRRHTAQAALNMIAAKPVVGFGWSTFQADSIHYFRDLPDIPMVGTNEDVHNVLLGRTAELGILGGGLWVIAMLLAFVVAPFRAMRGPMGAWQRGYVVLLLANLVVIMLTPQVFPMQAMLLAVWAGILTLRDPVPAAPPEPEPEPVPVREPDPEPDPPRSWSGPDPARGAAVTAAWRTAPPRGRRPGLLRHWR